MNIVIVWSEWSASEVWMVWIWFVLIRNHSSTTKFRNFRLTKVYTLHTITCKWDYCDKHCWLMMNVLFCVSFCGQFTFIYIELLTIQIVSTYFTVLNRKIEKTIKFIQLSSVQKISVQSSRPSSKAFFASKLNSRENLKSFEFDDT